MTGMAGGTAQLLDLQKDGIPIAIQADLADELHMAGGLPLQP